MRIRHCRSGRQRTTGRNAAICHRERAATAAMPTINNMASTRAGTRDRATVQSASLEEGQSCRPQWVQAGLQEIMARRVTYHRHPVSKGTASFALDWAGRCRSPLRLSSIIISSTKWQTRSSSDVDCRIAVNSSPVGSLKPRYQPQVERLMNLPPRNLRAEVHEHRGIPRVEGVAGSQQS